MLTTTHRFEQDSVHQARHHRIPSITETFPLPDEGWWAVSILFAIAVLSLLMLSTPLSAQTSKEAVAEPQTTGSPSASERGATMFRTYCASCHGATAQGDGPVADLLKVPPPNLTTLAQRYGGQFPSEAVRRTIDGRADLPAHGGRDMPVWGIGLQDLGRDHDQEAEVAARIDDLVVFLASIQPPAGDD